MESAQLGLAGELLQEAKCVLDGRQWTQGELHLLAVQLAEALGDVHRIAVSRGERLPTPTHQDLDPAEDEDDRLPGPNPSP